MYCAGMTVVIITPLLCRHRRDPVSCEERRGFQRQQVLVCIRVHGGLPDGPGAGILDPPVHHARHCRDQRHGVHAPHHQDSDEARAVAVLLPAFQRRGNRAKGRGCRQPHSLEREC